MALKKALPDVILALEITYQTKIWPSNILSEMIFFVNISCPDIYSFYEILNIFKTYKLKIDASRQILLGSLRSQDGLLYSQYGQWECYGADNLVASLSLLIL